MFYFLLLLWALFKFQYLENYTKVIINFFSCLKLMKMLSMPNILYPYISIKLLFYWWKFFLVPILPQNVQHMNVRPNIVQNQQPLQVTSNANATVPVSNSTTNFQQKNLQQQQQQRMVVGSPQMVSHFRAKNNIIIQMLIQFIWIELNSLEIQFNESKKWIV